MPIPVIDKMIKAFTGSGGIIDATNVDVAVQAQSGLLSGVEHAQTAFDRIDQTGLGADIYSFSGDYVAQTSNKNQWFGGHSTARLRCTGVAPNSDLPNVAEFSLPDSTALTSVFDDLVSAGAQEIFNLVIEFTGDIGEVLRVKPSVIPSPQVQGQTNLVVRSGTAAHLQITRESNSISDFVITAIGPAGNNALFNQGITFIHPSVATWDARSDGPLPTTNVKFGNAYEVVNAGNDDNVGITRYGEVMRNGDRVVWLGESFTSWDGDPRLWAVFSQADVRRLLTLEQDFLIDVAESVESDRNAVIVGSEYATSADELRLKIYSTPSDYTSADLAANGDIDTYSNPTNITGLLAIQLDRPSSNPLEPLENLFVYVVNADNSRVLFGNLSRDFAFRGNVNSKAQYTSKKQISYSSGQSIKIYIGSTEGRYENPNLDIKESNLSEDVKSKLHAHAGQSADIEQRLNTLESKTNALYPLTPDVSELVDLSNALDTKRTIPGVDVATGYTKIADYRSDSDRYEQTGINYDSSGSSVIRYSGFSTNLHRGFGFKVSSPSDKTLMSLIEGGDLIPFVDMTAAGKYRINNYIQSSQAGHLIYEQYHNSPRVSGAVTLRNFAKNTTTISIESFPAGVTGRTRTVEFQAMARVQMQFTGRDRVVHFEIPDTDIDQSQRQIDVLIHLGSQYNNRDVTVTLGYALRNTQSGLLMDIQMINGPSDINIDVISAFTVLSYTTAAIISRTDRWVTLSDSDGEFVFSGTNELLFFCNPANNNSASIVPVVRFSDNSHKALNSFTIQKPHASFDDVEIPDDIEFRTFATDHAINATELESLVSRSGEKWAYGLAKLGQVGELTFTEDTTAFNSIRFSNAIPTFKTLTFADGVALDLMTLTIPDANTAQKTTGLVLSFFLTATDYSYRQGEFFGKYLIYASNAVGGPGVDVHLVKETEHKGSGAWQSPATFNLTTSTSGTTVTVSITITTNSGDAGGSLKLYTALWNGQGTVNILGT